jgi:hypothetical protein
MREHRDPRVEVLFFFSILYCCCSLAAAVWNNFCFTFTEVDKKKSG